MDSSAPLSTDQDAGAVPSAVAREQRNGFLAAVVAHAIWGLLPLYLHLLASVPALQIMVDSGLHPLGVGRPLGPVGLSRHKTHSSWPTPA